MRNDTAPTPSIRQSLRDLLQDGHMREILRSWRWVLTFTRRHWAGVTGLTLFGLLSSALNLAAAIVTKNLIGSIIALDLDRLVPMAVLMVLCAAMSVAFQSIASRYSARLSTTMHQQIQKETFDRLVHADWMSVRQYPTGDLLSRFSGCFGYVRCADLLKNPAVADENVIASAKSMGLTKHCDIMINTAVEILEQMLKEQGK